MYHCVYYIYMTKAVTRFKEVWSEDQSPYVTGFHITRLPHAQNQTYDFTRNGLLV